MDRRPSPTRAGFTLIEVLIAILIVALLVAILLPAVQAAFRKAKEAQVSAELNNLATALASFKNAYGDYPPSRVILCERGYNFAGVLTNTSPAYALADSNCTDITVSQLAQRSLVYLKKFWPRADFLSDPGATANVGSYNDFDGSGGGIPNTKVVILSGSECLAFFLGGIPIPTPTGFGTSGFSKSPKFPFVDPVTATNRSVPNYEFNAGRLLDLDHDGIPSYLDPINTIPGSRRAFAYFSAYGANSYDPNDVNGWDHNTSNAFDYEPDQNGSNFAEWGFTVSFPVSGTPTNYAVSPSPNPYTSGSSAPTSGNVAWINPNSFQIICSGVDGNFGYGGAYVQGGTGNTLPLLDGNVNNSNSRNPENDNLTNFSSGRLN